MPLRNTKRVSNCAPRNVGSEVTLREPKLKPRGSKAPAGTGLDSVKPFCHSCETCTAANGVTANQPQACFHPASMRPLRRLLPKLPLAVSVGPMPTMLRVSLLRKVEKLSAAAAYSEAQVFT